MDGENKDVGVNEIVQISPEAKVVAALRGSLAVVDEVRTWGVIASFESLGSSHVVSIKQTGVGYVRLAWTDFERTGGKCVWRKKDPTEE